MRVVRRGTYWFAALYWLVTSLYGAISTQAFVQEQFLGPGLFPPLTMFAEWHASIGLGVLTLCVLTRLRTPEQHTWRAAAVATAWTAGIGIIAWATPLSDPLSRNAAAALAGIGAAMMALVALAEWRVQPDARTAPIDSSFRDLAACALAGISAALVHGVAALWVEPTGVALVPNTLWSLRLHLLVAGGAFLVITAIRATAAMTARPGLTERALAILALGVALSSFVRLVLFESISERGPVALGLSAALGFALALVMSAGQSRGDAPCVDGIRSTFEVWSPRLAERWWGFVLFLPALCGLAALVVTLSRSGDWNFVLARTGVVVVWMLTAAAAFRITRGMPTGGAFASIAVTGLLLAGHMTAPYADVEAASLRDPAARWLSDALDRRVAPAGAQDLAALVYANTNIPRDVTVSPVDVRPSSFPGVPAPIRPHVFVLVVDSLRRDYVSPYNPAVTFTPAIQSLADDSLVFRNAFTQYGATGLSVPALWVGGPLLHKQYVTPFAPMNSLARLLAEEQYAEWIGMDNIMEAILPPSTDRVRLNEGVAIKDYRLCSTLTDIRARLDLRTADSAPVFAYSLPQDVHVSVVTREGVDTVDGRSYPGFYAPVASRVARLDACLGEFVADLKARGLYDQSVIILTSDHGDSLGEEGRMGHAYSLHPEIVRVPLIMHVPAALRSDWEWNEGRAAFTTDLTPTLHRLLGRQWHAPADFFGEPLLWPRGTTTPPSRDRMVAASYGAVYGALLDGGTSYYVYDGMTMKEMAFSLGAGPQPGAPVPVTAALRSRGVEVIRRTIEDIAAFYRFTPGSQSATH